MHIARYIPPEFSIGFQRNMGPRCMEAPIVWWQDWPYTHVVMLIYPDGITPMVFQSHPAIGEPFKKSGPQMHTLEYFEQIIIPYWESKRWAKSRGGVYHWWLAPPRMPNIEQIARARKKAVELVLSDITYGLFWNFLFGQKSKMHCSQAVGAIQLAAGFCPPEQYTGHRFTPADCFAVYASPAQL